MKGNKNSIKRFLALLLSAAMIITYMPSGFLTYAEETAPVTEETSEDSTEVKTETPKEEVTEEPSEEQTTTKESENVVEKTNDSQNVQKEENGETSGGSDSQGNANDGIKNDEDKGNNTTYPATSFEPQTLGDVTISAEAPADALPEGTEMILEAASDDDIAAIKGSVNGDEPDVKAVKVIFTKDGETVTPKKALTYTVNAANTDDTRTYKVAYINADGTVAFTEVGYEFDVENLKVAGVVGVAKEAAKAPLLRADGDGTEEDAEAEPETWTVTFYNWDANVETTVEVEKGQSIGSKLPAVPKRDDYTGKWYVGSANGYGDFTYEGDALDGSFIPTKDTTIVPKYDLINYTVTFYKDDKTTVVDTRTVNADSNYGVNDMPAVPEKDGYTGKWVYSKGDFNNTVAVAGDTDVWADYTQKVFKVTFVSEGKTYQSDTYYYGDKLTLPSAPVEEGKDFTGWYVGEKEYKGGEDVTSDLTLTATYTDQNYVKFVVLNDDGSVAEQLTQYYRSTGESIGTMPQDPFVSGKVFEKWVVQGTDTEVTADTVVEGNMTVVAKFHDVKVYTITANYYYMSTANPGKKVVFNTDLIQVEEDDLPYTITAPASTKTDPNEVEGAPIYYAERQTVVVDKSMFDEDNKYEFEIRYKVSDATYGIKYMLKNLNGEGYTEIEDERVTGIEVVLGSVVTPLVKNLDYAVLESAKPQAVTEDGQFLEVKYTRKNYQVSYETNGGSYIAGATVPYGTEYSVTNTNPTRDGYTFGGWYTDKDLTQPVGNTVTVKGDTTLYAKWNGDTVNYTIVYMFEKYDDTGKTSSYVYDNSRDASGTVGSTVQAANAPNITRTGWEKDTAKNATSSVQIAADGSSVLFVYYKLRTYTLIFDRNHQSRVNDYIIRPNGSTTTNQYSINVKLGQDISALWPSAGSNYYDFMGWQKNGQGTRYVTKQLIMNTGLLPSNGTTLTWYADWDDAYTFTANYYLQNADDDGYTKSEAYSQTYNANSYGLTPKEINGYTFDHGNNTELVFEYNLYYNRNTYDIDYYAGSTKLKTIEDVKFDATITSKTYNWTPTAAQCGVDSDYTFAGWYADAGLTTPYTFSKMPASNLVLYAKWTAPSFKVKFVDDDGTTALADEQTVEKYHKAEKPANPTKAGYVFDGWFTSKDGDVLFDWNNQIVRDTTAYAHWTPKTLSYTVKYLDEENEPVVPDKNVIDPNLELGDTVNEQAVAVAGYRPDAGEKTLTLSGTESEDVIIFRYTKKVTTTSYTVHYILDPEEYPGNIPVAESKTVETITGDASDVIELAAQVDYASLYKAHPELDGIEFYPDKIEKTLVLSTNASQNVLTFYYSSYKNAKVTVHYVDMNGDPIATDHVEHLKVGKTFTVAKTPIEGWELYKAVKGTTLNNDEAANSYKITEAVTEDGLEFTLFYQKKATITAVSKSKQYDGTALTLPAELAGQVTVDGLKDGDKLKSVDFTYANADSTDKKGRLNAGVATVTPKDAAISGSGETPNYYKIRYISGTLEVTKINVTVRIEPDRWTGNEYNGTEYKTGFTNGGKDVEDYVMISHDGYKAAYLDTIWENITKLSKC